MPISKMMKFLTIQALNVSSENPEIYLHPEMLKRQLNDRIARRVRAQLPVSLVRYTGKCP